jgi:DNA-binding MarR family transcriptional regulator
MTDETLQEQAEKLECLLPRLMRRLFTLEIDHPAMELPLAQLRMSLILQGGPRSISSLSEEMSISVSATTQIADRLERAGMVARVSDAWQEDARCPCLPRGIFARVGAV